MSALRVILASASPRRKKLLSDLGVEFETIPSGAAEVQNEDLTAREASLINAYRKARAVAKDHPDAVVVGADTLVYVDTTVFGKPANDKEAEEMLQQLAGRRHNVVTGVCLLHLRSHKQRLFSETTEVTFRKLGAAQIRSYVKSVKTGDKAGAYAIQERGEELVEKVSGSYANVVGLPVERLRTELQQFV